VIVRTLTLGGLEVRIIGDTGDGPIVVMLHGFGAPGDDLVPLGEVLAEAAPGARFLFPAAPLALPAFFGESRAWWMIDMEALERDMAAGVPRDRSAEVPDGMAEANARIMALLAALPDEVGDGPLVLGGFSQGAMLSCDVALRSGAPLAGLVLLSGTFLAAGEWRPRLASRRGLRVFQSHGRRDPLLPFGAAERLRGELTAAGLEVDWHPFDGAHEIPPQVLRALDAFLRDLLAEPGKP
jgi:phospholipase/carboxylesterase